MDSPYYFSINRLGYSQNEEKLEEKFTGKKHQGFFITFAQFKFEITQALIASTVHGHLYYTLWPNVIYFIGSANISTKHSGPIFLLDGAS